MRITNFIGKGIDLLLLRYEYTLLEFCLVIHYENICIHLRQNYYFILNNIVPCKISKFFEFLRKRRIGSSLFLAAYPSIQTEELHICAANKIDMRLK